jgi:hypothetical protein
VSTIDLSADPRDTATKKAEMYRNEARECEEDASKIIDAAVKSRMLELAELWRKLAHEVEHAPTPRWACKTPNEGLGR